MEVWRCAVVFWCRFECYLNNYKQLPLPAVNRNGSALHSFSLVLCCARMASIAAFSSVCVNEWRKSTCTRLILIIFSTQNYLCLNSTIFCTRLNERVKAYNYWREVTYWLIELLPKRYIFLFITNFRNNYFMIIPARWITSLASARATRVAHYFLFDRHFSRFLRSPAGQCAAVVVFVNDQ